jgi:hypothetical protein
MKDVEVLAYADDVRRATATLLTALSQAGLNRYLPAAQVPSAETLNLMGMGRIGAVQFHSRPTWKDHARLIVVGDDEIMIETRNGDDTWSRVWSSGAPLQFGK